MVSKSQDRFISVKLKLSSIVTDVSGLKIGVAVAPETR
jgi:hypothetical protein